MRFLTSISFALILLLGFNSCGGDSASNQGSSSDNKAKAEKPAATFVMKNGDEVKVRSRPLNEDDKKRVAENSMKKPQKPGTQAAQGTFTNQTVGHQDPSTLPKSDRQKLNSVPDACALISVDQIAQILGVQPEAIAQKDASHTKSPFTRSCFYRWDGASPNTGVLLQVQGNPVAEEYAEWVSLFVESKRTTGDKEMGTNETHKYEKMEGLGDDGSFSHRLGKYVWRDGNNYAFLLSFNTNSAPDVQMRNVKKIGKIVMDNYAKLYK